MQSNHQRNNARVHEFRYHCEGGGSAGEIDRRITQKPPGGEREEGENQRMDKSQEQPTDNSLSLIEYVLLAETIHAPGEFSSLELGALLSRVPFCERNRPVALIMLIEVQAVVKAAIVS